MIRNDDITPVRYPKKEINPDLFHKFFSKYGKYPGKEKTMLEVGPIWERTISRWTTSTVDVFNAIEKENINHLKEIYENYYIYGTSDGASSGKSFLDKAEGGNGEKYKLNKAKRNHDRAKILSHYLNLDSTDNYEIYNMLSKKITIPESPNHGQAWGWWHNDIFIHFELMDYIYFFDTISKLLSENSITKTCFLGEGSGLLSSLVYSNCNITSSTHIDLSHFLLKQYLDNHNNDNINYYYAEDFKEDTMYNADILINQDSFPEISDKSVDRYIKNAKLNKVPYILSYNHDFYGEKSQNTQQYKDLNSDYRTIILNHGYTSIYTTDTIMRPGYLIELFELN